MGGARKRGRGRVRGRARAPKGSGAVLAEDDGVGWDSALVVEQEHPTDSDCDEEGEEEEEAEGDDEDEDEPSAERGPDKKRRKTVNLQCDCCMDYSKDPLGLKRRPLRCPGVLGEPRAFLMKRRSPVPGRGPGRAKQYL